MLAKPVVDCSSRDEDVGNMNNILLKFGFCLLCTLFCECILCLSFGFRRFFSFHENFKILPAVH